MDPIYAVVRDADCYNYPDRMLHHRYGSRQDGQSC